MRDLKTILSEMDPSLFEDSDDDYLSVSVDEFPSQKEPPPYYVERIPNDLAVSLLSPSDFDASCEYYLVTDTDETVIMKVNPSISEDDEKKALELDPETTCLRTTQYVLESDKDVQSFADLRRDYVMGPKIETVPTNASYAHLLDEEEKGVKRSISSRIMFWIMYSLIIVGGILLIAVLGWR